MPEELNKTYRVSGHVKWFDPEKGYGFVVSKEGGPDILLHVNVLRSFGQSSITEGAVIEIMTQQTDRGVQATEVVSVDSPVHVEALLPADFAELDPTVIENAPLEAARVKWFDKERGFGFANVFGSSEDVFIHIGVLRQSGLAELNSGEALAIRVIDGKRGRMAVQVLTWEAAVSS